MTKAPRNDYEHYHAHLYFDAETVEVAARIIATARAELDLPVGRFHRRRVGPHPMWSCQLAFDRAQFQDAIEWLERHRQGLTVFVHGLSGDDYTDHTAHASWLGKPAVLDLSVFDTD